MTDSVSVEDVLAPLDSNRFQRLDYRFVSPNAVPIYGRGAVVNRYKDILPAKDSRVKLRILNDDPSTEYINANYVSGANGNKRHYIAAQGPLPATVTAFLRMIVEQQSTAVVMITKLIEEGRKKCEQYWPDSVGETKKFGDIKVTLRNTEQDSGFVRNELEIVFEDIVHNTVQFWFNSWPDRGVPTKGDKMFTNDVIKLLFAVRKHRGKTDRFRSPAVVHCSAGVGRTGCFICVDQSFGNIERSKYIDLIELINENRKQRMAFVQTEIQYRFVHRIVSECAKWYLSKAHKLTNRKQKVKPNSESSSDDYVESNNITVNREIAVSTQMQNTHRLFDRVPSSENTSENQQAKVLIQKVRMLQDIMYCVGQNS